MHSLSIGGPSRISKVFIIGGTWWFNYGSGEICDYSQLPRETNIFYHCNNVNNQNRALLEAVSESIPPCSYSLSIASTLACVPENSHNANCQWRVLNENKDGYYYLDLSELKGTVVRSPLGNDYEMYTSICSNSIHCWQQHQSQVMSIIDNRQTGTCEHSLAVWEDGRVQPLLHQNEDETHWTFHYWNGQKCSNGQQGENKIRFFCDKSVTTYKVLGAYGEGDCIFDLNISTKDACLSQEPRWVDVKQWFDATQSSSSSGSSEGK